MAEYINKEDLKFLEIPIAPVLQGEQVHYEKGFLKEWLESVPPADVVERSKIDKAIEEMEKYSTYFEHKNRPDLAGAVDYCIGVIQKNIGERKNENS